MKIQIPKDNIIETEVLNINDIPLSFVNTNDTKLSLNTKINADFLQEKLTPIRPYSEVSSPDILLFDKNYTILPNIEFKRQGNKYIYEPQNMIEYNPLTFNCNALIKKNMKFKNDKYYNLKISVIENNNDLKYSNNLIKIFADAYRRGIAPSNISVNNKSFKLESLISSTLIENDFVFAHSLDGVNITNENDEIVDIDIIELLNNHVNIWLSVDSFDEMMIEQDTLENIVLNEQPILFNILEYPQNKENNFKKYIFTSDKRHEKYLGEEFIYIYFANSILIIEKKNSGYLIVSPSFVLNDLENNAKLVYEVLMQVFLKSYYLSLTAYSWITNEAVDYMAYSSKKLNSYHKNINLVNLLKNSNYDIDNEYSLIDILTSDENVKFKNLNSNQDLFFYKTNTNLDPVKKDNEISFLTTKQTIINYAKEDINFVETKFFLEYNILNNIAYITINPYYSSSHKMYSTYKQTLVLKDFNIEYYICAKETSPQIETTFTLISSSDYSFEKNGYILCYVTLATEKETNLYDVRVKGGGLPENQANNYNLMDIGNPYGRPYRIGSTMIIRLPEECKQYESLLYKEINKHISSGEYPIIVYE